MKKRNKIAILTPYPFDRAPSQRFRIEQYLSYFEEYHMDYDFFSFLDEKGWYHLYQNKKIPVKIISFFMGFVRRFSLLWKLNKYDKVFIHREVAPMGPPFFEWFMVIILKKELIYDFDDAIWLPNYSKSNALFHRFKAYWKIKYIIKYSSKVLAGNAFLAEYAKKYNENTLIIPTTIDTLHKHNIQVNHNQNPLVIGWTGTHTTLHYVEELIPVLKELERKYAFEFHVICNVRPDFDLKSMRYVEWSKKSEIEDLSKINIGLMPLKNNIWAKGKCAFKALQYMALEIPVVLSPVGTNLDVVTDGVEGYFADNSLDWKQSIERLIIDAALRKRQGEAGRAKVEKEYSVTAYKQTYLKCFQ